MPLFTFKYCDRPVFAAGLFVFSVFGSAAAAVAGERTVNSSTTAAKREITVGDLLAVSYFGDPRDPEGGEEGYRPQDMGVQVGLPSPDGKFIATLLRTGDATKGTLIAKLYVFQNDQLARGTVPPPLIEVESDGLHQPLMSLSWAADSKSIFALKADQKVPAALVRINVVDGTHKIISQGKSAIENYVVTNDGSVAVVWERATANLLHAQNCMEIGCLTPIVEPYELASGRDYLETAIYNLDTGERRPISPGRNVREELGCRAVGDSPVSPDGRYLLESCRSAIWKGISAKSPEAAFQRIKHCIDAQKANCFSTVYVTDLNSGSRRRLGNREVSYFADFVWTGNQDEIVASAVPADIFEEGPAAPGSVEPGLAVLRTRLSGGTTTTLGKIPNFEFYVDQIKLTLDRRTNEVVLGISHPSKDATASIVQKETVLRFSLGGPLGRENGSSAKNQVRFELRQIESKTAPPVLVAHDLTTGRQRRLLAPNEWLKERQIGLAEAVTGRTKSGVPWRGELYLPAGYQRGTRLPLVIQNHGTTSGFTLTGRSRNFGGRALNGVGIAVFQMFENYVYDKGVVNDFENIKEQYESIIATLVERGVVDGNRIALQGWSASGPDIQYVLTHSEYPIAAAAFTDTGSFGWTQYTSRPMYGAYSEQMYGSLGFGAGLKKWLESASTFAMDRVRAPILMWEAHTVPETGETILGQTDWKLGLDRLKIPNEHWIFPNGGHDIFPARKRMFAIQMLVDWYRYWLKDEARSDLVGWNGETRESLSQQYERWKVLRGEKEALLKKPRPPLLRWTAMPVETGAVDPAQTLN